MKKFVAADVQELNINETANGIFCSQCEFWFVTNDNKADKNDTPEANS